MEYSPNNSDLLESFVSKKDKLYNHKESSSQNECTTAILIELDGPESNERPRNILDLKATLVAPSSSTGAAAPLLSTESSSTCIGYEKCEYLTPLKCHRKHLLSSHGWKTPSPKSMKKIKNEATKIVDKLNSLENSFEDLLADVNFSVPDPFEDEETKSLEKSESISLGGAVEHHDKSRSTSFTGTHTCIQSEGMEKEINENASWKKQDSFKESNNFQLNDKNILFDASETNESENRSISPKKSDIFSCLDEENLNHIQSDASQTLTNQNSLDLKENCEIIDHFNEQFSAISLDECKNCSSENIQVHTEMICKLEKENIEPLGENKTLELKVKKLHNSDSDNDIKRRYYDVPSKNVHSPKCKAELEKRSKYGKYSFQMQKKEITGKSLPSTTMYRSSIHKRNFSSTVKPHNSDKTSMVGIKCTPYESWKSSLQSDAFLSEKKEKSKHLSFTPRSFKSVHQASVSSFKTNDSKLRAKPISSSSSLTPYKNVTDSEKRSAIPQSGSKLAFKILKPSISSLTNVTPTESSSKQRHSLYIHRNSAVPNSAPRLSIGSSKIMRNTWHPTTPKANPPFSALSTSRKSNSVSFMKPPFSRKLQDSLARELFPSKKSSN